MHTNTLTDKKTFSNSICLMVYKNIYIYLFETIFCLFLILKSFWKFEHMFFVVKNLNNF